MSVYSQYQLHKNLFVNAEADGVSPPIFAQDFKTIQVSVLASDIIITYSSETGPLTVGEVVTSDTGALGLVVSDNTTDTLVIQVTSGDWTGTTTATGSDSGSVATVTGVTFPSFGINVLKSNQDGFLPNEPVPDPTQPVSSTNMYSGVAVTDESNGVNYSFGMSYDPATNQLVASTFNVDTTGARWIWVEIINYVSGVVEKVDVELFSNFN